MGGAAAEPCVQISGMDYAISIPGDFPGGEMPPGDVNVWVVDWEACYMRPGPETCPTVKVAPGDYVFFKWAQYHDVAYAPSKEAYDMCTDGFENISGPVTGAGGSYMLRVPEDAPTEELYVVCSVPGHCGTGQKLVIDVSPEYACDSGDDVQDEAEDDTDTEDEGDTDTEDEGDMDAEGEDEDMESGVFIDPDMSGNATLTIGNITTGA